MVKVKPVQNGRTTRMSFSRINEVIGMPNLIEIQKNSYNWFLEEGLHEVFHDIAAIEDYTGNLVLEFVDYRLDKNPKYSIKECKERDATYAAPLYVTARLFNKQTGEVKEQEIFMGDFPLMTDAGTFISNGAERAIVSQLVRSPGVFYGSSKDRTGKDLFTATMNPNRGAWLEYETDSSDVYYVRIDKNRKLPVTTLLRALGLSTDEQIKQFFGDSEPKINASLEKDITHNTEEGLLEVYRKLRPGEPPTVENSRAHLNNLFFDPRRYDLARFGRYKMNNKLSLTRRIAGYKAAEDIIAPLTGELLAAKGEKINMAKAEEIDNAGVTRVTILVEKKGEEPRPFIVISNGCVNAQNFFSFDVEAEAGVNERANFAEIRKILDTTSDVEEQKELLRAYYGLDKPFFPQLRDTIVDNLHGDFGQSIHYKRPVADILLERLPWSLWIMGSTLALSLLLGVALSLLCVRRPWVDRALYPVLSALAEVPPFLTGVLLLFLVAARAAWIPLSGAYTPFAQYDGLWQRLGDILVHSLMPVCALTLVTVPKLFFTARASFFTILGRPYLTNARAKGLTAGRIRTAYILRNAATPIVARFFLSVGGAVGGTILVENVFAYPGLGTVLREAVQYRDYPMLQGVFLLSAVLVLLSLAAADVVNRRLDGEEEGP